MKKSPNKTHNLAKLLTIISILFLGNLTAKGQYINPYSYASALSYTLENDRLKNITFNENELKMDADTWQQYKYYQEINAKRLKEYNKFATTSYIGLGLIVAALIPVAIQVSADYDDPIADKAYSWGAVLLSAGTIVSIVGAIGALTYSSKINDSKKEMIIYLKTNHNGLGIVSVF